MVATRVNNTSVSASLANASFSPLFIAAMVATQTIHRIRFAACAVVFQSAFHRGNGCYFGKLPNTVYEYVLGLSVRFSSRQWLLRLLTGKESNIAYLRKSFSPLFIAAMVATPKAEIVFGKLARLFFQSAFHRGNGCYSTLPAGLSLAAATFQSAFHRGNGCYPAKVLHVNLLGIFQSAFHRGNGCYGRWDSTDTTSVSEQLSVRFSSRQWLLLVKGDGISE